MRSLKHDTCILIYRSFSFFSFGPEYRAIISHLMQWVTFSGIKFKLDSSTKHFSSAIAKGLRDQYIVIEFIYLSVYNVYLLFLCASFDDFKRIVWLRESGQAIF